MNSFLRQLCHGWYEVNLWCSSINTQTGAWKEMISPCKFWCEEFPKLFPKSSELLAICVTMGESTQRESYLNHSKFYKPFTLHHSEEGFCSDCNPASVICVGHEAKGTSRGTQPLPTLPCQPRHWWECMFFTNGILSSHSALWSACISVSISKCRENWCRAFVFSTPNHSAFSNKGCKWKTGSMRLLITASLWWLNSLGSPKDPKIHIFLLCIMYKYEFLIKICTLLLVYIEQSWVSKK